ncbi:DNA photolyase family protein [Terrimonas sp. NA20]|uniref:DNA photolyase family protein n=1 Tax=Terrimonas ginsenosidimutans TaxID=2908004 RepID=A0ABS9KPC1_9BACT|nr:deoxyribodipyrimidine photo-lyase [Terrimonas ginsenosidimutans]MCG2614181.1 DNA photolyase family protein [Terrimonas ginsenosidimutans]
MKSPVNICWFRRDLRLDDNAALYHALKDANPVVPVFIFDKNILDGLEDRADRRVEFIREALLHMQGQLEKKGSTLDVRYGTPEDVFKELLKEYKVEKVFTNGDYEPYARERDQKIAVLLKEAGASFHSYKDQVIFERNEVIKDDGTPYTVYTPYARKWKALLNDFYLRSYPCKKYYRNLFQQASKNIPSLADMNFTAVSKPFPSVKWKPATVKDYKGQRDFPGIEGGTTHLGVHLRFGTISVRELAREAGALNETFLGELIWRDFFQTILWHFPRVVQHSFRPEYDKIKWRNNEEEFRAWCSGETGYPIVDAGMRELNDTGFMHNRVRMITASFLTKHLLIDWRWGEAYFGEKLLDYDLSANNGNWQWAAGTGCDAAPYFRIFNPYIQTKKFDADLTYVKKWVPEFEELTYPRPIVEHEFARERCLKAYKAALNK